MKSIITNKYFLYLLPAVFSIPFMIFYSFFRADVLGAILFFAGLYLGQIFYLADEKWFYNMYASPEIASASSGKRLITRSTLFILIFIPLSLFIITSSGSMIGMGMILGIQLSIVEEMWRVIRLGFSVQKQYQDQGNFQVTVGTYFKSRFFYDLKLPMTQSVVDRIFYFSVFVLLLSSILVFT